MELLFIIAGFVAGIILTYLFMKAYTINRKTYDASKNELSSTKSKLEAQIAIDQQLRQQLDKIHSELTDEKTNSKKQEKTIAELNAVLNGIRERLTEEKETNIRQQEQIENHNNKILELRTVLGQLKAVNNTLQEKIDLQCEEFEVQRKKSLTEFENIANKLFEENSNKFSENSQKRIEQLLNPLKDNLSEFKKKVEETYEKESKQRFSLEDKIKELVTLNQQISQEATNLTNALKGQAKTQGDWGEMILENILDQSGLVKGREYDTQSTFKDGSGRSKQPDVRIRYPDDRYVIVDAKVSLTAYERYVNSEDKEEQQLHLNQHLQSVKNHVDNLASKEYDQFNKGLDFVFLFVPIEPAFLTAIHYDQNLWQYAYKKRIVLMSPTNLIATLKLIQDIWKREYQNRNAQEIAERGTRLYEKFVGFIQDMEDIGTQLSKTQDKYNQAFGKLSKGSGNLIGQVEKLKKLGLQSKKEIDDRHLIDNPELGESEEANLKYTNANNNLQ